MDCFDDDPFETSSSRDVKVDGVHQLLEEGWFFGKLLTRKPRSSLMLRCYSDPTPNFDQAILAENNPCIGKVVGNSIREPSLLPCIGWREEKIEEKQPTCRQLSDKASVQQPIKPTTCAEGIQENRRSKVITGQPSKHKLLRTPSLPPCIGRKEVEEEEENDDNITMSRLIRQAMSPRHTSKLPDSANHTTTSINPPEEGGTIELPLFSPSIFATTDDPSPLQVATSVLLTGAIAVFLFRSIRRRAKRAKELVFRFRPSP
ncbi:hypothetical protein P3X46_033939 [Hevea brasiliensis]|uniref:Uncharacterized protein n=1 Tax=Hevea brasiliensis TaxID=3981 RepID=A0ABQ9KAJ8_HEVBR|nr:hypothetical protein P3X46_033939 [Hevea brasiliensis]